MAVGRLLSYWEGKCSGAMLNFGRVTQIAPFLKIVLGRSDPFLSELGLEGNFSRGELLVEPAKSCENITTFRNSWCWMEKHQSWETRNRTQQKHAFLTTKDCVITTFLICSWPDPFMMAYHNPPNTSGLSSPYIHASIDLYSQLLTSPHF